MSEPTVFQLLAQVATVTRHDKVRLKPYDRLDAVVITDTRATVVITTHKFRESGSRVTLTHQGTRMIDYRLVDGRGYVRTDRTLWDDSFRPLVVDARWEGLTQAEWYDKRDWEALCARPGDGTRLGQRDSVGREVQAIEDRLDSMLYATSTTTTEENGS